MSFMKNKYASCYTEFKNNHKTGCFLFDSISDSYAHQISTHSLPLNRERIISNVIYLNITPTFMLERKLRKTCCGTKDCDLKVYDNGKDIWDNIV